jgi:3-dehydroquinate dehydratase type I
MTGRPPLLVVTLPARSVPEAQAQIRHARDAGADLAEVRLDRFPIEERSRAADLFPSPLPLLATVRSQAEGGEGPNDPGERATVIAELGGLPFRWIDLELDRDVPAAVRLPPADRIGRIVSVHLRASETPRWEERLAQLTGADGLGKLVMRASVPFALKEILPRLAARSDPTRVVLTVGPSGPLLRALSKRLRAPIVFVSLPSVSGEAPVEPSQIPVDRLRPFLDADGEPPLFAVAGRPVAHSESPAIHSRWMRDDGRPGLYLPLEFADEGEFRESLPLLAEQGFRGLNVTHPFKAAAFAAATERRAGALACAAANCLTFRDGQVEAENTDLAAILRRLVELRDEGRWDGSALSVIGAGGSARATLAAARLLSVPATVYARRSEAARELAREFGATAGGAPPSHPPPLVVHATSAGRREAGALAVSLGPFVGAGSHLVDWVYRADDPSLRRNSEAAGATYEDGWRLLVYQAAASYTIWWGREPAPASIAASLAEGVCAA